MGNNAVTSVAGRLFGLGFRAMGDVAHRNVCDYAFGAASILGDHVACEPDAWFLLNWVNGNGKGSEILIQIVLCFESALLLRKGRSIGIRRNHQSKWWPY